MIFVTFSLKNKRRITQQTSRSITTLKMFKSLQRWTTFLKGPMEYGLAIIILPLLTTQETGVLGRILHSNTYIL